MTNLTQHDQHTATIPLLHVKDTANYHRYQGGPEGFTKAYIPPCPEGRQIASVTVVIRYR